MQKQMFSSIVWGHYPFAIAGYAYYLRNHHYLLYARKDITHALFFKRYQLREVVDVLVKAVDPLPQVNESDFAY